MRKSRFDETVAKHRSADGASTSRGASGEASTSGRPFEAAGSQRHPIRSGSSQQQRWQGLGGWGRQLSLRASGSLSSQASMEPSQPSPKNSLGGFPRLSLERRLMEREGSLHLQKGHQDSLLDILRQRAGSQELSSQGLSSLLNAPNAVSNNAQGTAWSWPFGAAAELPLTVPPPDPAVLPPVSIADFQPYLQSCGSRLARFEALQAAKAADPGIEKGQGVFTPGDGLVEAMKTVPAMFFKDDFSLASRDTWQEVLSTEDEEQRLARLEGYNLYVDTVEAQLAREIAALQEHSTEFFQASSFLQDLRASLNRAYSQVTAMRRQLSVMRAEMQAAAVDVTSAKRRRANLEAVLDKLKVVEEVASAQNTIELLLPQGDFADALDVLDSLKHSLAIQHTAGLHAFHHLPSQLTDIAEAIDTLLSAEFVRATTFQQQEATAAVIMADCLSPDGPSHQPIQEKDDSLEDELLPLVLGLKRTGHLGDSIRIMRTSAAEEVKVGIREVVEGALATFPAASGVAGTTEKLQALYPEQFLALLRCVRGTALASLGHVRQVQRAVEGILKAGKAPRGLMAQVGPEFDEVIQSVSEAAHSRWIKLLAARSFLVASLSVEALGQLMGESERFAAAMQEAGSRPVYALRNASQAQSRAYLESMHASSLNQLATAMEKEPWSAVPSIPPASQHAVDALLSRGEILGHEAEQQNGVAGNGKALEGAEKLRVGQQSFKTVQSQLLLLSLLTEYLAFLDTVPGLAMEVAHRLVELVKVFNSRMCQLVLGAGAMQAASLKSITAKHLALSCQCVGVLLHLHPALVASLGAKLPAKHRPLLDPEFNLVFRDLTVHRAEVHAKLVNIMRERLIASLKQLPSLASRWGTTPGAGEGRPSSFAENLVKQLRTLSQVVSPMLQEEELHAIFGRLAALYSKNLAEAFSRIEPQGKAWTAQAASDLGHVMEAFRGLPMPATQRDDALDRLSRLVQTRFSAGQRQGPPPRSPDAQAERSHANAALPPSPSRPTLVTRLSNTKLPAFFSRDKPSGEDPEPHPSGVPRPPLRPATPPLEADPSDTLPTRHSRGNSGDEASRPQLVSHTSLGAASSVVSEDLTATELASAPDETARPDAPDAAVETSEAAFISEAGLEGKQSPDGQSPRSAAASESHPAAVVSLASSTSGIEVLEGHRQGGSPTAIDAVRESNSGSGAHWQAAGADLEGRVSTRVTAENLMDAVQAYEPGREPMGLDSRMPSFVENEGRQSEQPVEQDRDEAGERGAAGTSMPPEPLNLAATEPPPSREAGIGPTGAVGTGVPNVDFQGPADWEDRAGPGEDASEVVAQRGEQDAISETNVELLPVLPGGGLPEGDGSDGHLPEAVKVDGPSKQKERKSAAAIQDMLNSMQADDIWPPSDQQA